MHQEFINNNYTVVKADYEYNPNTQYISSITYTEGTSGSGSLANTQTDDSNYKQINAEGSYIPFPVEDWIYQIVITFNINPPYAGRDFYLSVDIVSGVSMTLKKNGGTIASGTTIDFDDMLLTGTNSITLAGSRLSTTFNSKIYYFKLVEDITPLTELDVQVDIEAKVDNSVDFLRYSHRTNESIDVDLDIWDWTSSTWYEIDIKFLNS
jgi:hypothetical protein